VPKGSDDYQGMIVGFLVVLAVAVNELRRHGSGQREKFFAGALGLFVIPIQATLVGAVIFVMLDLQAGFIAFASVFGLLGALKIAGHRKSS